MKTKMTRVSARQHGRVKEYAKAYDLSIVRVLAYVIEKGLLDVEANGISLRAAYGKNDVSSGAPQSRIDVILAMNAYDFDQFCQTISDVEADEYFRLRTNMARERGGLPPLPQGWKVGDPEPKGVNDEEALLRAEAEVSSPSDPRDEEIKCQAT